MTKQELIDKITSVNPTTTPEFLLDFSERNLSDYMHQLDTLGLLPREYDDREKEPLGDG